MSSKHLFINSIALLCVISLGWGQKRILAQREIWELQDQRSLGNGKLVSYLQDKDKGLRFSAAVALGNIQDTTTVPFLVPTMQDEDVQVRAAAAFALGQIGSSQSQKILIAALTKEQDMAALARVFEALGKCGDEQALNAVVAYIPSGRNMAIKRDQALSIARFAIRNIRSERGVWLCYDLLNDSHSETRWAASYALWRSAPLGVIDLEISKRPYVLSRLFNDENAEVRVNIGTLLGRTKSSEAPALVKLFHDVEAKSADWRVQVQIVRAAAALAALDPQMLTILSEYLLSTNDHVRISSIQALESVAESVLEASPEKEKFAETLKLFSATPSRSADLVQGESMVALNKLFPAEFQGIRTTLEKSPRTNLLKSKYIEALSMQCTSENLQVVFRLLTDDSVRVEMAAWDFVKRMVQPARLSAAGIDTALVHSIPASLVRSMHTALERRDFALTTLVANAFADSAILASSQRAGFGPEIEQALIGSYRQLASVTGSEAMDAIQTTFLRLRDTTCVPVLEGSLADADRSIAVNAAKTLQALTGRSYVPKESASGRKPMTEREWKELDSIPQGQRVVFKTTKGTFTMRLRKDAAPFTVLAFCNLVKQKFYNGLTFHRVIPDFVVQGGDPRGDGWGGPGFTIRSEWSLLNFVRGSVGLASSGKDTEGCQFFIAHIPTPHLDGRYTIFATVSSGMEVVDKIQVGDRIISAELR